MSEVMENAAAAGNRAVAAYEIVGALKPLPYDTERQDDLDDGTRALRGKSCSSVLC